MHSAMEEPVPLQAAKSQPHVVSEKRESGVEEVVDSPEHDLNTGDGDGNSDANTDSSSSDSAGHDIPAANARVFKPPVPPAGGEFWQHAKSKTLHIRMEGYYNIFICGRARNDMYTQAKDVRWDSAVCHGCLRHSYDA